MEIAKVKVTGTRAYTTEALDIPQGIVGATVSFEFGPEWAGLTKNVVFVGAKDVEILGIQDSVYLPPEVVSTSNIIVRVGVVGVDGNKKMVIPTLWADLGAVKPAAPVDMGYDPTLPIWAQLLVMIGDLRNLNTDDKSNLVAAVNEAMQNGGGGSGGYYTPVVTQPTANTMQIFFVPSVATMPAVEPVTITLPGSNSGQNPTVTAVAALPILYLVGDTTEMTKETRVDLRYTYVDTAKNEQRTGWCDCKWQGDSSLSFPKKNFTIRFYHDPSYERKDKINFGGLTNASKWVTKANYVDQSHARNVVSARLWGEIVRSRVNEPPTEMLESAPNYGAINGYPILMYINGEYHGLYTMNIPKDEKLFGMDTDNPLHCAICGNRNNNGNNTLNLSTEFRSVNFSHWENEVPEAWNATNETALTNLINFVKDSTDGDFRANLNTYLDVESAIDYYIFMYFSCDIDGLGKNMILATYDGTKWYCSAYDMDIIWGNNFSGTASPETPCPEGYRETNSLLWQRMEALFGNEIYDRYTALRQTILSVEYVNRAFEMFIGAIPESDYKADEIKWPNMGQAGVDHLSWISNWVRQRAVYVDAEMLKLTEEIPCTSLLLSNSSLAFLTQDKQTVSAIVTPGNTTDPVVWSTSDDTVATVTDGVITPVGNGSCVITATCGEHSAECSVSINAFTEEVSKLPEGYTQLEYIVAGSDRPYFDTGVMASADLRINAKVQPSKVDDGGQNIVGDKDYGVTNLKMYSGQYGNEIVYNLLGKENRNGSFKPIVGTDYLITMDESMGVSVNGATMFTAIAGTAEASDSLLVCNRRYSSGELRNNGFEGRIYFLSLHKGTALVADYVPCTNPDGIVGMYDLVTATFHGSEGTAQFTAPA